MYICYFFVSKSNFGQGQGGGMRGVLECASEKRRTEEPYSLGILSCDNCFNSIKYNINI